MRQPQPARSILRSRAKLAFPANSQLTLAQLAAASDAMLSRVHCYPGNTPSLCHSERSEESRFFPFPLLARRMRAHESPPNLPRILIVVSHHPDQITQRALRHQLLGKHRIKIDMPNHVASKHHRFSGSSIQRKALELTLARE